MPKKRKCAVILLGLLFVAACNRDPAQTAIETAEEPVIVKVPKLYLQGRDAIPGRFECDIEKPRPPVTWKTEVEAEEFVLTIVDQNANDFAHWIVYSIPGDATGLDRVKTPVGIDGTPPEGAKEGRNDYGQIGYGPPCPPEGDGPHNYHFSVYALDEAVTATMDEGASLQEVLDAIECCVDGAGALSTAYER